MIDDPRTTDAPAADAPFRSGFVCFMGRPNAGKSTLTNALVGQKVAITSSRPQTTRHAIRGVVNRADGQLILVDTPGVHRPRTLLGERLNDLVAATAAEVDVVGMCLPADEKVGPGDRFIADRIAALSPRITRVCLLTKSDKVGRPLLMERLLGAEKLAADAGFEWAAIIPVSAVKGDNTDRVARILTSLLPEGPMLFPDGEATDDPVDLRIAEIVREAALEGIREELPHSLVVRVEEIIPQEDRPAGRPKSDVHVTLYVERDSQKGIIIGKGGARLREIGVRSRPQVQALLGVPVHLALHVKLAKDWQQDPKQLQRLGF